MATQFIDGGGAEQDPHEMWSAIVGATPAKLPLYLEAGFAVTSIGESASIDLTRLAPEIVPDSEAIGAFADPTFPAPVRAIYEERRHPWVGLPDAIQRIY